MPDYRPAERVRLLVNAAHTDGLDATVQEAREVATDSDPAAVLVHLAQVEDGALDICRRIPLDDIEGLVSHARLTAAAIAVYSERSGEPFKLVLDRLLGAIPGPQPGTDPDLGI